MATTSSSSWAQPGGPEGRSDTTAGSQPIGVVERPRDHRPLGLAGFYMFADSASRPVPGTFQQTLTPELCPAASTAKCERSPRPGRRVGATEAGGAVLNKSCLAEQVRLGVVERRVSTWAGRRREPGPTRRPGRGRSGGPRSRAPFCCYSLHTGYDDAGKIVEAHSSTFRVQKQGPVRTLSFSNLLVTEGPAKGHHEPAERSYIYRYDGEVFVEVWGILDGDDSPPLLAALEGRWSRLSSGVEVAITAKPPPGAARV